MEKKILYAIFGVLLVMGLKVSSYPNGPPSEACESMHPGHGQYAAQTGPSPFVLTANVNCFNPSQRILLTLKDSSQPVEDFEGFFVQARLRSGPANSYGVFDTNNQPGIQTINCFNGSSNSIGHSNDNDKLSVTFGWTAPSNFQSSIEFKYTVAEDFDTFWVGLEYDLPLCSSSDGGIVTLPSNQPTNPPPQPTFSQSPSCLDQNRVICSLLTSRGLGYCRIPEVKAFCCGSCSRPTSTRRRGYSRDDSEDSHDRY